MVARSTQTDPEDGNRRIAWGAGALALLVLSPLVLLVLVVVGIFYVVGWLIEKLADAMDHSPSPATEPEPSGEGPYRDAARCERCGRPQPTETAEA